MRIKIRQTARGVVIAVRLTPKSSGDVVEGVEQFDGKPVLKARVRALPEGGRANAALEALIANWLGVPRIDVAVVQGGRSRVKQVAIDGNGIALSALIGMRLAEL